MNLVTFTSTTETELSFLKNNFKCVESYREIIMDFSPKIELLDEEKTKKMLRVFKGERTGWVRVGDKGWFFPHKYLEQGEGFLKFKARPDDTWVVSYPRSGTTWTQELVWLLANNLDFNKAGKIFLADRFPFLEYVLYFIRKKNLLIITVIY